MAAVSDYVPAAADETAALYGIRSCGNDCDGMIRDPEVEAVLITSIDATHHDYVMKVLAQRKWCFCEKPLSQNAKLVLWPKITHRIKIRMPAITFFPAPDEFSCPSPGLTKYIIERTNNFTRFCDSI